jgi:hypothetical protein
MELRQREKGKGHDRALVKSHNIRYEGRRYKDMYGKL